MSHRVPADAHRNEPAPPRPVGHPRASVLFALCLAALGTGGCAHEFTARRLQPPPGSATAAAGDTGTDLRTLENTAAADREPPPALAAEREARRLATARLVERYAPALLAAPRHVILLPAGPDRRLRLVLRRGVGPGGVDPANFAALVPAGDYTVEGQPVFSRTPGVGTPLVGTRRPVRAVSQPEPVPAQPVSGLVWTVTAVPVLVAGASGGMRTVFLDLYDPHTTGHLVAAAGQRPLPLAADYTTPIAVVTAHFQPQNRAIKGVLNADAYFANAGLYSIELPTTEKIPLVFVHGLISDPTDFHFLINRLAGDPELRRRYQVWVFYYPTSLPVVYSAMLLREDLSKFIQQLDPVGTHPALHRAVLVGHSMGGLLCRLAVSDGGDRYYHHFFSQPLDELELTGPQRALVRRAFYYRASPDVAQVVFIATPHRGSSLASGFPGNLARLLVRAPVAVLGRIRPIVANNRAALAPGAPLKPGTSLNSLSPDDPLIAAVNDIPIRPCVGLHSILGDRGRGGPPEKSSDGVVPYRSSHLPQAVSERIVPAGHTGTLHRPETVDELERILVPPGR